MPVAERKEAAQVYKGEWDGGTAQKLERRENGVWNGDGTENEEECQQDGENHWIQKGFPRHCIFSRSWNGKGETIGPEEKLVHERHERHIDRPLFREKIDDEGDADESRIAEDHAGLEHFIPFFCELQETGGELEDHHQGEVHEDGKDDDLRAVDQVRYGGAARGIGENQERQEYFQDDG